MRAFKRNSCIDWAIQLELAKKRDWAAIDPGVYVRNYSSLKKIGTEYAIAQCRPNVEVHVHWGITHSGKSHNCMEALKDKVFYIKDSETKWFDGYRGEKLCFMDEFRGTPNIAKVLRWWDKWPCNVEVKGGSIPMEIEKWYVTSNMDPKDWYPDVDQDTRDALLRRITTTTKYVFKWTERRALEDAIDNIFN